MLTRPLGIRADCGFSYRILERVATNVREQLGLPPTAHINSLRLFDRLEVTAKRRNGQEIPLRGNVIDLEDSEGFTKYNRGRGIIEILASVETYEWFEQDYPRGRFFLAHELGHCLLHTDQLVRMAHMPLSQQEALHRGGRLLAHEIYRDTEWQANAFASAFLMPALGLLALEKRYGGEFSPNVIAENFRVSFEAASYRVGLYLSRKQQLLQARRVEGTRPSVLVASSSRLTGHGGSN